MRPKTTAASLLTVFLAACAALLPKPEPPRLTVADLKLADVGLFEQRYQLKLRVQNPNSSDLPIGGLDYELLVNEKLFASGVSSKPVTIPAYGTDVLEVEGFGSLADVVRQLLDLRKGVPAKFQYQLRGHVRVKDQPLNLPFDQRGEISLAPEGGSPTPL